MAKEIEVKYLVDPKLDPTTLPFTETIHCWQGYTVDGIRFAHYYHMLANKHYYKINYKVGSGASKDEYQCDITKDVYDGLWPLTEGQRIEKFRYVIPHGKYMVELDVYVKAKKLPLMTAEIEVESEEEILQLSIPLYFIQNVTSGGYSNRKLSC